MKKLYVSQKIIIMMISILLILASASVSFGGGGFDTRDNTSNEYYTGGTGGSNNGSVFFDGARKRSGTRYVFRVPDENGIYYDIGGKWCDFFYLNHFYSDKKGNVKNDDAIPKNSNEMLLSGTIAGRLNTKGGVDNVAFNGMYLLTSGGSVFKTYASSREDYVDSLNGVKQYRHVIAWYKGKGDTKTGDFGLNDDDIILLIDYLEEIADRLIADNGIGLASNYENEKDEIQDEARLVKSQIEKIRNGKMLIQIRAEIIFRAKFNNSCGTKIGVDVSTRIRNDSSDIYYPVTWREALAIGGGVANTRMEDFINSLYEKNELFTNEAKYVNDAQRFNDHYKALYFQGWDYIYWGNNPYVEPQPEVVVKYVLKNTGRLIGQSLPIYIESGDSQDFNQDQVKVYGDSYIYTKETKIDNEDKGDMPIVSISGDGKSHEIIFFYKQQVKVNVLGVYAREKNPICIYNISGDDYIYDLPVEKIVYEEASYNKYAEGYKFLKEVERFDNTSTFVGKNQPDKDTSKITFSLPEDKNTPQQILIVFYYEPTFKLTVKHLDKDTGKSLISNKDSVVYPLIPGKTKTVNSYPIKNNNYFNSSVILDVVEDKTPENLDPKEQYSVSVDYNGKDRELIFYYRKQKLVVKHLWTDGTERKEQETVELPTDQSRMKDYVYVGSKLNNVELGKKDTVHVDYDSNIKGNQELIFYYDKPGMIVEPKKPQDKIGIIPSNLYNQLIGQLDNEYYWVLNEKGEITVRVAVKKVSEGTNSLTCKLNIPFDFYLNNNYHSAGEFDIGTLNVADPLEGYEEYDIYEKKITNIYVPVWTEEKQHTITGIINYEYTPSTVGSSSTSVSDNATANVTVVGALYDFTITNLDGSDTTGDSMWKKSLFPTVKQVEDGYKAKATAIGQGTQQPSKYYQAIKRGTRFYFSLNTLGAANSQIEIVPSFYYVSADGTKVEKVTMESKYRDSKIKRSINLNDTNRITNEFSQERAKKKALGDATGTIFEVGNYDTITLTKDVSTPYLNIVNDIKIKFDPTVVTNVTSDYLFKVANHWYGDYSIPNDATFLLNGKQVDENGYLIVYFSIITTRKNEEGKKEVPYLAYDLDSPFVQEKQISEWKFERQGNKSDNAAKYTIKLPQTSVSGGQPETGSIWIREIDKNNDGKIDKSEKIAGHTAVIIYSLKPNVSTKQNVTSAGTH